MRKGGGGGREMVEESVHDVKGDDSTEPVSVGHEHANPLPLRKIRKPILSGTL